MNAQDRFRRVDALFRAASALPAEARETYLAQECGGETSILVQVQSLLSADQRADGVLDRPALVSVSSVLPGESAAAETPPRIGGYRIIRKIGEGGMGSVFEAEQENPRRRVALKLLREAVGARRMVQRFQQEVQILGRLQHPGIAQILEAGSTGDGAAACPYFVMELVHGSSLIEHAREQRLGFRERLELFALVCDAVHYAHQCGVIHRDLKPANILVVGKWESENVGKDGPAQKDAGGATPSHVPTFPQSHAAVQPKILDFGVARLTDSDLAAVTQQTSVGELIGTVPYMSPEQAAGDPAKLDWRSDVYSLGVILFELLTGRLPHDVRRLLVHEAVRVIREDEPTPAGSIDRSLRGDVETILAKALEKDRQRRYQSAAELAADMRRYLHEQPIAARPASALYRIAKFTRRNKALVGGLVVAFVSLAAGTIVAVRQAILAERARVEEHRLRGEAERESYRANLVAASAALRYHETTDARRHLDAAPAALRGWEWEHLSSRIDDSLATLQTGFVPMRMALSPDGMKVVSCSSAGNFRIWRVPEFSLYGKSGVYSLVRSRVIERFVYSADGCELRVDTRSGAVRLDSASLELIDHDRLTAPQRDRDGRYGLFGEPERGSETILRELAANREILHFQEANIHVTPVRFSDDGGLLAIGLDDERGLRVYRANDGALWADRSDLRNVTGLAFTADGTRLAVATGAGDGYVLDPTDGRTIATLTGNRSSFNAIEFSPDGERIATIGGDRTVRLWRAADGELLSVMHGHQGKVSGLAFSPDGQTVVTASIDKTIRWWDARAMADPFVLDAPGSVYGVAFSPDGRSLAAACLGGERPLRIWDVQTGRELVAALDGYPSAVAYSRDGARIAAGRARGETIVVAAIDGREIATTPGHWWRTNWVAFDGTGEQLLSLGNGGRLHANQLSDGRRVKARGFAAESTSEGCRGAVSPDGSLVVVATRKTIHLLDGETWADVGKLLGHTGNVYAVSFSPDGTRLVSAGADRTLRIWNVGQRTLIATLSAHSDEVFAAIFSPDGKRIFSGGRDRVIRVWDTETFDEITQLHGHAVFVYCLTFSPDGRTLASGGGDATVRLWGTRPYREWRARRMEMGAEQAAMQEEGEE